MELRISVKTPKGQAKGTRKKLQPFLIGGAKKIKEVYVNKDDSEMIWVVEGTPRDYVSIMKRLQLYETMISGIFKNKIMKKFLGSKTANISDDQQKELNDMLTKGTKIKIIKNAEAEEWVEANKTWWQRMKDTFNKED